ncbi:AAA family ATPase [Plantactinospora sp. GCM10030261]|uniref:helix-turn-helix transcriptional regulator n=1 Tax=Plantactinospora sp. GCM10030261 TaxID=3273420 RepID=UPI00360A6BD7
MTTAADRGVGPDRMAGVHPSARDRRRAEAGPTVEGGPAGGGMSHRRGILDVVTARVSSRTFVGREADTAALRDALRRVDAGEQAAVLIGGEAGVGKSRLMEEFGAAVGGDADLFVGQCLELGEEGLPFAPFAAVLREVLRRHGRDALAGQDVEFARLLPELARPAAGARTPLADAPTTDRGYLFELVGELLARLSEGRPTVVVIEDLHWADRSTRDLIAFLIRAARPARTLLICTYRTDELHRGHPLRPFLAELDRVRGVERRELTRLDRDGTATILTDLLGAEPPALAIDTVFERAQGNPFFIEELAAAGDPAGCATMPDSLRDLLLARVERLPEAAQRVLRIAAAGGTRIAHELLATAAGLPDGDLEEALRATVAAQLVVADADGGYVFRHALVREAVHDELLPGEHARLHARYAAAIEADPQLVPAGRAPAEIAHHWHAAHDHPRALVAALAAAKAASCRYAYAEQSRLLERVLELWEQVPDAAERLGMDHVALVEEALAATWVAGDHVRALSLSRAALAEVDPATEPLRAARLLGRRGRLLAVLGKSDGTKELSEAYRLATAAETEDPQRVRLIADLAGHLVQAGLPESDQLVAEALVAAKATGDPVTLTHAHLALAKCRDREVSPDLGLTELREAERLARQSGDPVNLVPALGNISDTLFELGRYAESARVAADGAAEARRLGVSRSTGAFLLSNRAEALLALGEWQEADEICAEAARIDVIGTLGLHWLELRARLRLARGEDGADELVARALGFLGKPYLHPQQRLPLHELRIEAALCGGDLAGAVSAARAALTDPTLPSRPRYGWPLLAAAGAVAVRAGEPELIAAVEAIAARLHVGFPAERAYAAQLTALLPMAASGDGSARAGLVAASGPVGSGLVADAGPAVGDAASATRSADSAAARVARWQVAVDAWRVDGRPYQLARAFVELAEAAAAAGDRTTVTDAVTESAEIARRLGARPLAERVAQLARRVGLRGAAAGAAPGGAAVGGTELLTSREREVLRLVAEGLSNSQIAGRLFISPKTASVHVSRIIAKLDVTNRIEAAAVAHRLGLLT